MSLRRESIAVSWDFRLPSDVAEGDCNNEDDAVFFVSIDAEALSAAASHIDLTGLFSLDSDRVSLLYTAAVDTRVWSTEVRPFSCTFGSAVDDTFFSSSPMALVNLSFRTLTSLIRMSMGSSAIPCASVWSNLSTACHAKGPQLYPSDCFGHAY